MGTTLVAWAAVATVILRLSEIAVQVARWRHERNRQMAPAGEMQRMPLGAATVAGSTTPGTSAASMQVSCRRGAVTVTAIRAGADR